MIIQFLLYSSLMTELEENNEKRVLLITTRTPSDTERVNYIKESEIRSLINTLGLIVTTHLSFTLKEENPNTYIGKGQLEEARENVLAFSIDEVVVDGFLSPRQEKLMEKTLQVPVSDREAIILSIFFQNAHSKEAKLQIMKAEAVYLKPRLQARDENLSQQRGGVRGAKGEGERKIELDRRIIERTIKSIDKEISEVRKIRATQRKTRESSKVYSFALTGYTNAGKSTILNALANADIKAEDKLFATLDTTTRAIKLKNGQDITISDTVGFIRNLPASLIEAFSSTLEEALSADGIIIVADASHIDAAGSLETTIATLRELEGEEKIKLLIINKIDSYLDDITLSKLRSYPYKTVETSFKDNTGIDKLLKALEDITDELFFDTTLLFPSSTEIIGELSRDGYIKAIDYEDSTVRIKVRLPKTLEAKYANYKA